MSLKSTIESLLFISIRPLSITHLQSVLEEKKGTIEEAIKELTDEYVKQERGLRIVKNGAQYQMVTGPDSAEVVKAFLKDELTGELTQPQLETLTVVAYRGPVTKTEIEMIRGVNCTLILRNLLMRGMVEEAQNNEHGIPVYSVSFEFMRYLGVADITELPGYAELNEDQDLQSLLSSTAQENSSDSDSDVGEEVSENID